MSDHSTKFQVLLKEEQEGGVNLKFDINANNIGGEEQQTGLFDHDIGDSLVVLGDMTQVVHGALSKGGSLATLIGMRFEFQPGNKTRRFKAVEIKVTFAKGLDATTGPEVYNIVPKGTFSLLPSNQEVELSHTVSPSLQAGAGPGSATFGYQWQSKTTEHKEDTAKLIGAIRALGPDKSRKNTVTWKLFENPHTASGIPTLFETAILLKRGRGETSSTGQKFSAAVEIHGEADMVTTLKDRVQRLVKSVRGKAEKGEDVIFNPLLTRGTVKDPDNLMDENLEALSRVETITRWEHRDVTHGDNKSSN